MPRPASPELRLALIERAAEMLARREPITLRSLVRGTGASTMAVYTYFGSMEGLWAAVRQEGFRRLGLTLEEATPTADPVRDLARASAAYVSSALAAPHLYRTMFDASYPLPDPAAAGASFAVLVDAAVRAREVGRFTPRCDPQALATRWWVYGHGLITLVLAGVLPVASLDDHVLPAATAFFVAAGDRPDRCRRSVRSGWAELVVPEGWEPTGPT